MIEVAEYAVELRLNGQLIGDVRRLAQDLTWARRRTKCGVDTIDFTLNDVLFAEWCAERGTTIVEMLKPLALDCRVIRNGVPVVGGFLATMPAYSPNGTSANLALSFDGYINYLAGVYISPVGTQTGRMGTLIQNWITMADTRARNAGKAYGFVAGHIDTMASVEQTFDNYKTVKDVIVERCDNSTGAGLFDVYFDVDRAYNIYKDQNFGEIIKDYTVRYPASLNGVSATSISASEVDGFASTVIAVGAGEISSDASKNTAITTTITDSAKVAEYGYYEDMFQESSISRMDSLTRNAQTRLKNDGDMRWKPEITLTGRQVAPAPLASGKIWLGDTITINNAADVTGTTNGQFRVNELVVKVGATNAEIITPTLERRDG